MCVAHAMCCAPLGLQRGRCVLVLTETVLSGCVCVCVCVCVSRSVVFYSLQPIDCSPPGSSVHGILQARILECVAIPFSRGSSQLRDQTWICCTAVTLVILFRLQPLEEVLFITVVENEAHSMTTPGHMAKPKSDLTAASSFLPRLRGLCVVFLLQ